MKIILDASMLFPLENKETVILKELGISIIKRKCFSEEDLINYGKNADIIKYLGWMTPFTRKVFEKLPNLKAVVSHGVGYETIDIKAAKDHNVSISNTPGYCAEEVSTTAVTLLLSYVRKLSYWDNYIRKGKWNNDPTDLEGLETLHDEMIGIVGFGNIGRKIFEKLQGHSANFLISDPYVRVTENGFTRNAKIEELLKKARYIILACPLNKETHHLLDKDSFGLMRKDSVIINISRGGLINENELIKNLMQKNIQGAALDVFEDEPLKHDSPLLKMENVILTPHIGASGPKTPKLMGKMIFEEILRIVKGEPLLYRVA